MLGGRSRVLAIGYRLISMEQPSLHPDRNLAMELVRATEAAAIRSYPFIGRGDKNAADGAAVDAMRAFLATVSFQGKVVIGEGEKDEAPMLFNGEIVGSGDGPETDIAVDPIDGTSLTAAGRMNAISVIAVSDRGSMLDASAVYKMDKLVTGPAGVGVVDIRNSLSENIREYAKASKKETEEVLIAILDRDYNEHLIEEIRSAGARTRLLRDGDVAGGIQAARESSRVDMCVGIGGSPEGIVTACGIRALGGHMQGILHPREQFEKDAGLKAGLKFDYVYEIDEMVNSENTFFIATGVTDGAMLEGVKRKGNRVITESIAIRGKSRTVRTVRAEYALDRWS